MVDVRVRAAGAKGTGGRAFTLVFAGLDEACFFYDDSGAVNDRDIYRACSQRIVPGGQLWMVSTPWIDGVGLLEETISSEWGIHKHTVTAKGIGTRALNPTWDPDGTIEAAIRERDPDNADREIEAKALYAGSRYFIDHASIDAAMASGLPTQLPRRLGAEYFSGGDTGFVRNSSALAIVESAKTDGAIVRMKLARLEERKPQPGFPLSPKAVAAEFASIMVEYGCRDFVSDTHEERDVVDGLRTKNCKVVVAPPPGEAFAELRNALHDGLLDLPRDLRLRQQLRAVMSRPITGGGVRVFSPKSADGSHGDLADALARAVWHARNKESSYLAKMRAGVNKQMPGK